ncbi:MAG: DUF1800 family protein [Blastocatellia bacterium]
MTFPPKWRSGRRVSAGALLTFLCLMAAQAAVIARPAVSVSVSPASETVATGATRQFTATVSGALNSAVTWSVNNLAGGNATVGTISAAGLYTAPAALPGANPVTIRATSVADPMAAGAATVTVRYPTPAAQWYSPRIIPLGNTTFTINGVNFYNGAVARLDGVALPTTYVSSTQLRATSNVAQSGSGTITITNPGPASVSSPRLIEFGAGIVITLAPATTAVAPGAKQQFTATVTGTSNTAVYWSVNGGGANGTISAGGLYTAPAVAPASPVTIRASSAANSERYGTATVTVSGSAPQTVAVAISPASASPQTGATQQFTATVSGSANTAVTWQVNGVTGGGATNGTISNSGLYTAPAAIPPGNVTVKAISQADPTKSASAAITVTAQPITVAITISPGAATLNAGAAQQFTANVTGTANTAITWQVNNVTGGAAATGTINVSGLYTAPGAIPAGAITVTAVSQADVTKKATAAVTIIDTSSVAAGRLLEQTTFGPTPQLMTYVKQIGASAWLDEQFNAPESVFPNGNATTANELMDQFYLHFAMGQDQLRQRVLYALSEIIVISRNKNYYPNMQIPWLRILSQNAFGNYKNLLREITLDASMGNYLDMVNSLKPGVAGGANENYPRELMQLFSIGLSQLNLDGSLKLDANGKPIPTYNQTDIRQLALALTGWTFNTANGAPQYPNPNYYPGPMVPLAAYHDMSSRSFLGQTIPAGQPMQKDLDDVIEVIFNHPNVGPFIATRLIRALVTSNPTPGYIARVAAVFNDNGQGVRGDLKAVVRAILLDSEARNDTPGPDFGRLRTPVMFHIALFRALGATIPQPQQIAYVYESMGEGLLNAPSVFGHYSPMYRIPKQTPPLAGPEFQILGPGELVNRVNFTYNYMNYYQSGIWDLQWLFSLGTDHNACVNAVDNLLLYGRMSAGLRQALLTALQTSASAGADAKTRALTVLYLTTTSGEYQVMH